MGQLTGRVTIRIDGQELKSKDGAKLDIGGVNRETQKGGGRIHGYTEEDMQPAVEFKIAHDKNISLKWLAGLTGATVMFETDTGASFIMRDSYTTEPPSLTGNDVDVKMEGKECDELI